jgi:hypothetical protein
MNNSRIRGIFLDQSNPFKSAFENPCHQRSNKRLRTKGERMSKLVIHYSLKTEGGAKWSASGMEHGSDSAPRNKPDPERSEGECPKKKYKKKSYICMLKY